MSEAEVAVRKVDSFDDMLQVMQLYSAGLISLRTAVELNPWITDVDEELRRLGVKDNRPEVDTG